MKLSSNEKQRPYRDGLETKQSDESAAKSRQECELRPIEKISDRPKWSIVDQKLTQDELQALRRFGDHYRNQAFRSVTRRGRFRSLICP